MAHSLVWPGLDKGVIDVFPEVWLPNHKSGFDKYVKGEKSAEAVLAYGGAVQGWWIPTWVSEEYGIKEVTDLNTNAKLFDLNQNDKGDIWIGAISWPSTPMWKVKMREYGMLEHWDAVTTEQWTFLALLKEKMRKKEPIIFFYWTPEWVFAKYDLTQVKEPPYDSEKWKFDEKNLENSYVACEFEPATVYTCVSTKLKDRLPKAYQFFKNWYIPIEEMNPLIADLEDVPGNPKQDVKEVAKKWVEKHPDIVNDWLKGLE